MNIVEAADQVVSICKRPDKTAEAILAVQDALAYYTLKYEFPNDLIEATITLDDPTAYSGSFSLSSLTRFRKFKYLKITGVKRYLNELSPEKVFTPKDTMQTSWYYRTGADVNYNLPQVSATLEAGYYQFAPTLASNDTHWMLDNCATMLIDYAASKIFRTIGDDASSDRYAGYSREYFKTLINDLAHGG